MLDRLLVSLLYELLLGFFDLFVVLLLFGHYFRLGEGGGLLKNPIKLNPVCRS